jgi:hypothetical protein
MAGKAMNVVGFDPSTGQAIIRNVDGSDYRRQLYHLDRNTLVVLAGKLGYKLTKSPLKYTAVELMEIVKRDYMAEGEEVVMFHTPTTPVPIPPKPTATPSSTGSAVDGAFRTMIQAIMSDMGASSVDDARVTQLIEEKLATTVDELGEIIVQSAERANQRIDRLAIEFANSRPQVTNITLSGGTRRMIENRTHFMLDKVLRVVDQGLSPWLTGGAGVGKTTIAEQVAKSLDLDYSPESFCSQSSKAEMKGYKTANGLYESTEFRKRFEEGGVYLLDEVDAANPNILLALNSALSNGIMAFPDKVIHKHPKFVAIACANTYGNGATAEYVGRQVIDGSSVDRFVKLDIPVDENMEAGIVSDLSVDKGAGSMWHGIVRAARSNVIDYGLKVIVSPRASYHGAKLLNAGFTFQECIPMTFGSGMKREQYDKVMTNIVVPDGGATLPA